MFRYGGFKLLFLKVFFGLLLIFLSSFLFISVFSYSPNDPGIGKLVGKNEISNFFGFWGSISSSFFLMLFGTASLILISFIHFRITTYIQNVQVKT